MIYTFSDKVLHVCEVFQLYEKAKHRCVLLKFAFLFLLVMTGLSGCSNPPDSDFYEVDGLVTGAITDSVDVAGWKPVHFINSRGLSNNLADSSSRSPLTYSVYISTPGSYSLWLLAAYPGMSNHSTKVDVSLTNPDDFLIARASADIPQENSLNWQRADTGTDSNLISIADPGQYKISIEATGSADIQLHKFQMSLNNADQPFGLGLPSSTRTDLSAADLFRELPVMLPPAWVFNPVIGFSIDSLNNQHQELIDKSVVISADPGGIWTSFDSELSSIDTIDNSNDVKPARGVKVDTDDQCVPNSASLFMQGYQFFVTHNSLEVACMNHLHQKYRIISGDDRRSVFFHGIKNASNTETKQYPAPITPEYVFEWSVPPRLEDGNFQPGGYAELVDDLSNPAGSLYNMPFLSMPVDYRSDLTGGSSWDSELFIRTVQLSAFLPVMQLILPGSIDQFSESERRQILSSMRLRNSLFPYNYTHAHYTRQTNESIISGFRQYADQFMYGNAFLVAPVMEPGSDGRIVYFPEGRLWYNYNTDEAFEAGQSWFVETQLNQLPLFVKAGAVIPYQIDEDPEHLTIEIYTGDAGAFRLVEDDGVTRAYRRTDAARTMLRYNEIEGNLKFTIGAVQAGFEGMSDYRSYDIQFKHTKMPERIEINSEELVRASALDGNDDSSWRFNGSENEIILNLNNVSRHEKLDIVIYP